MSFFKKLNSSYHVVAKLITDRERAEMMKKHAKDILRKRPPSGLETYRAPSNVPSSPLPKDDDKVGEVVDLKTGKVLKKAKERSKFPETKPPEKKETGIKGLIAEMRKHVSLSFNASDDDLIDLEKMIHVDASTMSKADYNKMEAEIKRSTKTGTGYKVYAWNDGSGYDYWRDDGDTNYIQISAKITNLKKVDPKKLARDMESLYSSLEHWDNTGALDAHG